MHGAFPGAFPLGRREEPLRPRETENGLCFPKGFLPQCLIDLSFLTILGECARVRVRASVCVLTRTHAHALSLIYR